MYCSIYCCKVTGPFTLAGTKPHKFDCDRQLQLEVLNYTIITFTDTEIQESVLQKVPSWTSAVYILNELQLWININDNNKNIHCHFNSNWNLTMCMSWRSRDWISAGAIFHTHPDWPWGPPSLVYNGYQGIPGGTATKAWH